MEERLSFRPGHEGFVAIWAYRGKDHTRHRHRELELNLTIRGTGRYLVGDRCYFMSRDVLLWLFPGQDHVLVDQSPGLEMWVLVFTPELVARTCATPETNVLNERLPPSPAGRFCVPAGREDAQRLHALFAELRALEGNAFLFNAGLSWALAQAWEVHGRSQAGAAATELHPAVERAVRMMREDQTELRLGALARKAGLSPSHLSRAFKQQTGVPLARFRNQCRVERFLALYGEGRRRGLLDTALDAGFGSYPQFHRVFKEVMGYAPAEHRRRAREAQE